MKARIKFKKKGNMKFVGHLDIMRYFQKAIRRSGIDIEYSKGYSPHQIMSFAAPLGIGLTSDAEYLDIQMNSCEEPENIVNQLNAVMNEEIRIVSFHLLSDHSKNAMSLVSAADYEISLKEGYETMHRENFKELFSSFLKQEEIKIWKKTKRSQKEVDIRPFIYIGSNDRSEFENSINVLSKGLKPSVQKMEESVEEDFLDYKETYYLQLASGSEHNLKPELVMEAFCTYADIPYSPFAYQVNRMEVYGTTNESEQEPFLAPLEYIGILETEG